MAQLVLSLCEPYVRHFSKSLKLITVITSGVTIALPCLVPTPNFRLIKSQTPLVHAECSYFLCAFLIKLLASVLVLQQHSFFLIRYTTVLF